MENYFIISIAQFLEGIAKCNASTTYDLRNNLIMLFCIFPNYIYVDFFSGTSGIFSGGIFDFFLAHRFFFLGCNFANFFTGTIFFSRAVFKIFSRALANFLGQNLENFLVENFFFLGEKKKR